MMQTGGRTYAIHYSKPKIAGLISLALPCIALFAYAIDYPYRPDSRYPADVVRLGGVLGVTIFVPLLLCFMVKLLDRSPGLVLDSQGFLDRTTFISVGRVEWSDVRGLRTLTYRGSKKLVVEVHDPLRFVDRGNVMQRLIRAPDFWFRRLGPVQLRSVMLDTSFDGLVFAVTSFFEGAKATGAGRLSSGSDGV